MKENKIEKLRKIKEKQLKERRINFTFLQVRTTVKYQHVDHLCSLVLLLQLPTSSCQCCFPDCSALKLFNECRFTTVEETLLRDQEVISLDNFL